MSSVKINAIGTAVPEQKVTRQKFYQILEDTLEMDRRDRFFLRQILKHSRIAQRYTIFKDFHQECASQGIFGNGNNNSPTVSQRMKVFEQEALPLSLKAINNCVEGMPQLNVEEITHLITFSCTGMYAPGIDIEIVKALGMSPHTERTCINFMGCYAAINALKNAYYIIRSNPEAKVLLCGVELSTIHYKSSVHPEIMTANSLFGDGSAAVFLSNETYGSSTLELTDFFSEFNYSGKEEMTWKIGSDGFDIKLTGYVPELVNAGILDLTQKLMKRGGLKPDAIDYYAIHPGGVKILQACEEALEIDPDKNKYSYDILNDYGNMSSVTVLFVLKKYLEKMTEQDKGKNVFCCAFGPGLTVESSLLKVV